MTDKWIESARVSLDELEKEVKRLRELKYPIILAKEVKRLREGIEQALEAMSCHTNHSIYNSSWNILKELIE